MECGQIMQKKSIAVGWSHLPDRFSWLEMESERSEESEQILFLIY